MILGLMSAREALEEGFTHHARYFGIPVWFAEEGDGCRIAAKWPPMDYVIPIFADIEQFIALAFLSDQEGFTFHVGAEIDRDA